MTRAPHAAGTSTQNGGGGKWPTLVGGRMQSWDGLHAFVSHVGINDLSRS